MAARTWIGATSDYAADPNNWSPTGAPQPGDSLIWDNGGTMDVTGDALAGDTLRIGGTSSSPQDYVVNVSGRADFTEAAAFPPIGIGSITINLADHARWIGGFSTNLAGGVFITGDGTLANQNSLVAARSVVDVDVVGRGSFFVSSAQSVPGALEFTKSVSKGQAITVGGDPTRGVHATLAVDNPNGFHAATTLGFGEVVLGGLKADSDAPERRTQIMVFDESEIAWSKVASKWGRLASELRGSGSAMSEEELSEILRRSAEEDDPELQEHLRTKR